MALTGDTGAQKAGGIDPSQLRFDVRTLPDDELRRIDFGAYLARKAQDLQNRMGNLMTLGVIAGHKLEADRDHDARMIARYATRYRTVDDWDNETITYGGKQVSRAQAKKANQDILDNKEEYIQWGIKNNQFRNRQEAEAYIHLVRESVQLDKKIEGQLRRKENLSQEDLDHKERIDGKLAEKPELQRRALDMVANPDREKNVQLSASGIASGIQLKQDFHIAHQGITAPVVTFGAAPAAIPKANEYVMD